MFAFYLVSNGIGGRTVEELADNMTLSEFLEWKSFYAVYPFGQDRFALEFAALKKLHLDVRRKKGSSPTDLKAVTLDFMPQAEQTEEDQLNAMKSWYVAWGGKVEDID